ncbi:MAG: GMC family oxidoreductase [Kovacikia sp.]
MKDDHYDVIIIGTGAGGGTLARALAPSGKKILVLERGPFLPKEKANWDSQEIYGKDRYRTTDVWYDKDGNPFQPFTHYFVGGNTKFYGGALFRFRERDFEEVLHKGGISPEWPLKYRDFEPYYTQAEKLYDVHGLRGLDPTEPPSDQAYPFPPISHEPLIEQINYALKDKGFHPFYQPLAIKRNESNPFLSDCIRCDTCEGFSCLLDARADADVNGVRPTIVHPNLTLMTEAKVLRLHTSASGREVTGVETEIAGECRMFSGNIVVVACGAINSAALLLKSVSDRHPNGLANRSDLVGRNYIRHNSAGLVALSIKPSSTVYSKTIAVNDFYWGETDFPYPMGHVQSLGKINGDKAAVSGPAFIPKQLIPKQLYKAAADRLTGWFLMSEDLPDPNNRVQVKDEKISIEYTNNNEEAFNRLIHRWTQVLKSIAPSTFGSLSLYISTKVPLKDLGYQCGTCRFGEDPKTSVLDLNCRTHDVDNLYVVDGSFFPSSGAVNPTLTMIANALRVGEHILERLR